jgi:SAM-dependent methyltransferase
MGLAQRGLQRRVERALARQLDYQRRKAAQVVGREAEAIAHMVGKVAKVRPMIEAIRPIADDARVLEVGCGSMGLIFFFGTTNGTGVDPLADHYAELFPAWYGRSRTVAAFGEALPFEDGAFDLILCDNVVDHAEDPQRIVEEISRVLAPGGLLYFTVNVHHPIFHYAATLHAGWRALGIPFEITPFADHTVHLTLPAAKALFDGLKLRSLREDDTIAETIRSGGARRGAGRLVPRRLYKNALFTLIAEKTP